MISNVEAQTGEIPSVTSEKMDPLGKVIETLTIKQATCTAFTLWTEPLGCWESSHSETSLAAVCRSHKDSSMPTLTEL